MTGQQAVCLEEFLASQSLVNWVKDNLKSETVSSSCILPTMSAHLCPPSADRSDVKVYVELASITAGENDTEIDKVACFHDAVTGYSSLLYSLHPQAGFQDFMKCAEQVFENQSRDERLPDKLVLYPLFSVPPLIHTVAVAFKANVVKCHLSKQPPN